MTLNNRKSKYFGVILHVYLALRRALHDLNAIHTVHYYLDRSQFKL